MRNGLEYIIMLTGFSQTRILGMLWSVFACLLVAAESTSRYADLLHFGQVKVLAEGAARSLRFLRLFLSRLHVSPPPTYDWLFSLMSANCLGLRTPAAMTDG